MHRVFCAFVVICLVIAVSPAFPGKDNTESAAKYSAPLRSVLRFTESEIKDLAVLPEKYVGLELKQDNLYFHVFVTSRFSRNELEEFGVELGSKIGKICTGRIHYNDLALLAGQPEVERITLAVELDPMLDVSVDETGTEFHRLGCNARAAWSRATGKNVIVGIVDSGIDWDHGDFIFDPDYLNQSRILFLWDQTLTPVSGESPPTAEGFNYGVQYPASWINDELAGITSGKIRTMDTIGHGTHVAGIAGGDGSDSDGSPPPPKYIGVAPDADFIIVKTNLLDSGVIDGVDYVFQKAAFLGRPAVVNLSLGHNFGPHDNTSDFETTLNDLTGPGKLVVVAAGNNQGKAVHAEAVIPPAGSADCAFSVPSTPSVADLWIDIWVDAGDSYSVTVTSPGSASTGPLSPGGNGSWTLTGEGAVYMENYNAGSHPAGDREIFIEVSGIGGGNIAPGEWSFTLTRSGTGGDGAFDAWIAVPSAGIVTFTTNATEEENIAIPGTAREAVTVGAHNTKSQWIASNGNTYGVPGLVLGEIAYFSSTGPSRDTPSDPGYLKPEISAPGFVVSSSLSTDYSPSPSEIADDGRHRINQGTSMSAPHLTGALALCLQKRKNATPSYVKNALLASAWEDLDTGSVPNNTWGYGKMNVLRALDEFAAAENWELYE